MIKPTFCSKYFKSISGLSFALIKFPTINSSITLTISHLFFETVTNNPTSSIPLMMAPVYSTWAWVIGRIFLLASLKTKYPIIVSTQWLIAQNISHVAPMDLRSSRKVLKSPAMHPNSWFHLYTLVTEGSYLTKQGRFNINWDQWKELSEEFLSPFIISILYVKSCLVTQGDDRTPIAILFRIYHFIPLPSTFFSSLPSIKETPTLKTFWWIYQEGSLGTSPLHQHQQISRHEYHNPRLYENQTSKKTVPKR